MLLRVVLSSFGAISLLLMIFLPMVPDGILLLLVSIATADGVMNDSVDVYRLQRVVNLSLVLFLDRDADEL